MDPNLANRLHQLASMPVATVPAKWTPNEPCPYCKPVCQNCGRPYGHYFPK